MAPTPQQKHPKKKLKKKKWPGNVATQFTIMHPSFPASIQYGWGTALGSSVQVFFAMFMKGKVK
jgi:hypothetical protein